MKRLLKILAIVGGAWLALAVVVVSVTPQLRSRALQDIRLILRFYHDNNHAILPAPHKPEPRGWRDDQITAAWLGHATVLINFYGVHILTDPIFSDYAGPGFGPKRFVAPALMPEELPPIDLIVISHAHFDHMDMRSLSRLAKLYPQAQIITAANTADLLDGKNFSRITELAWQQNVTLDFGGKPLTVTALPVKHWGARWRRDTWRGYNGYLLERNGRRIVFTGDTAYTPTFTKLASTATGVDLFIVGIGSYNPWLANHSNPEQAVQMAREAGARHIFPIHFATFKMSNEPMDEPLRRFRKACPPEMFTIGEIGETFYLRFKN